MLGDRCGFGWSAWHALEMYAKQEDHYHKPITPCDQAGAVPPFPYASGAGYIFSSALLQWVATSREVRSWVDLAAGPSHERLQWQKFEDSTTGYWLSYAPEPVHYVSVYRWVHDLACRAKAADASYHRRNLDLYRPPSTMSLWVHGLKKGDDMRYANQMMLGAGYEHARCMNASWSIDVALQEGIV